MDHLGIEEPIRIAILTGQLVKGGAERELYCFLKGADRTRFNYTVILLNPGGYWVAPIRELGFEVVEVPAWTKGIPKRVIYITRLLREIKPAICHSWNFYTTAYAALCGRLAKVPVTMGFLQDQPGFVLDGLGFKAKLIFRSVDAFIANSEAAVQGARSLKLRTAPMFVVHNPVMIPDVDRQASRVLVHTEWGIPREALLIGTVGRIVAKKNHKMFVEVVGGITGSGPDVFALIVGDGILKAEIEGQVQSARLERRVVFTGERNDVDKILPALDVFCSSSVSEGLANAVQEAMAAGVPVVATDVGGIRELIDDGKSGFIVPSEDVDAMVQKVQLLLSSQVLRIRMGDAGREKMRHEFTVEKMVNTLENVYETCLAKRSLRRSSLLRRIVGT